MKFTRLEDALLSVCPKVSHYFAVCEGDAYIVWAEEGQGAARWADDRMQEQAVEGWIDYYTKVEDDPLVDAIQDALNDAGIAFWLSGVEPPDKAGRICWSWGWMMCPEREEG